MPLTGLLFFLVAGGLFCYSQYLLSQQAPSRLSSDSFRLIAPLSRAVQRFPCGPLAPLFLQTVSLLLFPYFCLFFCTDRHSITDPLPLFFTLPRNGVFFSVLNSFSSVRSPRDPHVDSRGVVSVFFFFLVPQSLSSFFPRISPISPLSSDIIWIAP